MKRFKNILFVADTLGPHLGPLLRAAQVAKTNGARLTLMTVANIQEEPFMDAPHRAWLRHALEDELQQHLTILKRHCEDQPIAVDAFAVIGKPFLEVIHAVNERGFDLLVKAADPPQGHIDRLFGGTDLHLFRKCPCPVWIEPPDPVAEHTGVLAAIDPVTEPNQDLSRTILQLATSMARLQAAPLHVVHVWEMAGKTLMTSGRSQMSDASVAAYEQLTRQGHREAFDRCLAPFREIAPDLHAHLVHGSPAPTILKLAEKRRCSLVIMGTVARTGIPGLFIGNTAEEVLQSLKVGVLAVKPGAFVTPVE